MTTSRKNMRGFASMTAEQRKQIASMGGRAAHALGTAHRFSAAEASIAGRKGGLSRRRADEPKNDPPIDAELLDSVVTSGFQTEEIQPAV
jgi:hypothetical protein